MPLSGQREYDAEQPEYDAEQREYDVVVLGAGSTGENVAGRAAAGGLSAVVVEAELVGGDCSYWACIPSKALLQPVEAVSHARSLAGASSAVTGDIDADAVLARRDSFTSVWADDSQVTWLDNAGVDLVRGHGSLTATPREVAVRTPDGATVTLTARHAVVLAVGSLPALPPIDGLEAARPWTSRDGTSAKQVPRRLIVLGGGVVGCELATAWQGLGAQAVTVLQRSERLLPGYEPEVGRRVRAAMSQRGIDVRTSTQVVKVARANSGEMTVTLDDGSTVVGDELLVGAGRKARTNHIGLDAVGLEPGAWVSTDDSMRVQGVDGGWLYAAGDVTARAPLTHMGKYQARVCADVVLARARGEQVEPGAWAPTSATADTRAVTQVVFTDPQVASVGLTERQARDAGIDVRVVAHEVGQVAGAALYADGYDGWAQLVVDQRRGVLVGATFLGAGVGELLHAATIAIVAEVPLARLWHAVPAFPTISEVWLKLLEDYGL